MDLWRQVIENADLMPSFQETVGQMRADETCPAGY
jgi:hypothetical protein